MVTRKRQPGGRRGRPTGLSGGAGDSAPGSLASRLTAAALVLCCSLARARETDTAPLSLTLHTCDQYGGERWDLLCADFALLPAACASSLEGFTEVCVAAEAQLTEPLRPGQTVKWSRDMPLRHLASLDMVMPGQTYNVKLPMPLQDRQSPAAQAALRECLYGTREDVAAASRAASGAPSQDAATAAHRCAPGPGEEGGALAETRWTLARASEVADELAALEGMARGLAPHTQVHATVRQQALLALEDVRRRRLYRDAWLASTVTLEGTARAWADEAEANRLLTAAFTSHVVRSPSLWAHRLHLEQNSLGMGERAFHWLWHLVVQDALGGRGGYSGGGGGGGGGGAAGGGAFRFLEVGVYRGATPSLVGRLALAAGLRPELFGVSPLGADTDLSMAPEGRVADFDNHRADVDYVGDIVGLLRWSGVPPPSMNVFKGLSTDAGVLAEVAAAVPRDSLDALFIDGGHEEAVARSDLWHYAPLLRVGGVLVVDDCANNVTAFGVFKGIPEVARAVDAWLPPLAPRDALRRTPLGEHPTLAFEHLFAVGHERVWRRVA